MRSYTLKDNRAPVILVLVALLLASLAPVSAQKAQAPVAEHDKASGSKEQAPAAEAPSAATGSAATKDASTAREVARQGKILEDTNKLYDLVQELKVEVSKSSKDTLSLSVIKKASEIEKLAKSLKERMRPQ